MSKDDRDNFLFMMYKKCKIDSLGIYPVEINQELGIDDTKSENIITRLEYDGFVEWLTNSSLNITAQGIDYIESNSNDEEVIKNKNLKMIVLNEYYKVRDKYYGATQEEINSKLSIHNDTLDEIIRYLLLKGYIEQPDIGPYAKITSFGIDKIENNIS